MSRTCCYGISALGSGDLRDPQRLKAMIHYALSNHVGTAQRCFSNEGGEMEVAITDQQAEFSDYGSDFTPDEEEILTGLLQQAPQEPDNPITDPDLQLKDIEDEVTPRGARVRALEYELRALPTPTKPKKSVTFQAVGDCDNAANSVYRNAWLSSAD